MRAAILIGVERYTELQQLPACRKDVIAISEVLAATGQYDSVLRFDEDAVLAEASKAKILEFLADLAAQGPLDELLFYFSGHGDVRQDGLYYAFSDYSNLRPRQTGLQNEEVDVWLRRAAAAVTVKLVDCCYAGVSYVKAGDIQSRLELSAAGFKSVYFMQSSQAHEVSYVGDHLSKFTEAVVATVSERPDGPLRYGTLIEAVADKAEVDGQQVPKFVVDASFRDTFCIVNEEIRQAALNYLPKKATEPGPEPVVVSDHAQANLQERVEEDAKACFAHKQVEEILNDLRGRVEKGSCLPDALGALYERKASFLYAGGDAEFLPSPEAIGRWLAARPEEFFARARRAEPPMAFGGAYQPLVAMMARKEIVGFDITAEVSFDTIRIDLLPRYPNVAAYQLGLVVLLSKRRMRVFFYKTRLVEITWGRWESPPGVRFTTKEFGLGTAAQDAAEVVERLWGDLMGQVEADLVAGFG